MKADMFDREDRQLGHETQIPIDELQCFEMGKRLLEKAMELNR